MCPVPEADARAASSGPAGRPVPILASVHLAPADAPKNELPLGVSFGARRLVDPFLDLFLPP
jgi:hypothetical protein